MSLLLNFLLSYSIRTFTHICRRRRRLFFQMPNSFAYHIFFHAQYTFLTYVSVFVFYNCVQTFSCFFLLLSKLMEISDISDFHLFTHLPFSNINRNNNKKNNTNLDKSSFYRVETVLWCVYTLADWTWNVCMTLFFWHMYEHWIQCGIDDVYVYICVFCTVQKN